ncbi:hypothetical protein [Fournierella sp.]|uniref:hypothetical protein n=1 Tax=Allofournierella sp. TaxID=1940256 RepID=UPI00307918BF
MLFPYQNNQTFSSILGIVPNFFHLAHTKRPPLPEELPYKAGVTQENDGSALGFWRTKCSKGRASHQGLLRPFSHFLHPKSWGRTTLYRKRSDFDGSAGKSPAGTLGGCQGALTLQSRKSGPFPALFSYVTPAKAGNFNQINGL